MDLQAEHVTLKTENSSLKEAMADIVKELADGVSNFEYLSMALVYKSTVNFDLFPVANAIRYHHFRLHLFRNNETSASG